MELIHKSLSMQQYKNKSSPSVTKPRRDPHPTSKRCHPKLNSFRTIGFQEYYHPQVISSEEAANQHRPSIPSGLGQDPLNSLGSACPKAKAMPLEVPLSKLCISLLGSQSLTPHQLSLPSVPMMSSVFSNAVWTVAATAVAMPVSKE